MTICGSHNWVWHYAGAGGLGLHKTAGKVCLYAGPDGQGWRKRGAGGPCPPPRFSDRGPAAEISCILRKNFASGIKSVVFYSGLLDIHNFSTKIQNIFGGSATMDPWWNRPRFARPKWPPHYFRASSMPADGPTTNSKSSFPKNVGLTPLPLIRTLCMIKNGIIVS